MSATSAAPAKNELALIKSGVIDVVANKVREFQESKQLMLPANYSVENAMKSAWLILQATVDRDKRPVLEVCSRDSIANALLDMAVQGLNPAKKQGYFIAYGGQLAFQRSYFGTMAVVKQVAGARDIYAQVVYGGDEFEYVIERGRKRVVKHVQNIANVRGDNIVAAYCTIEFAEGREFTDIMTWEQIQKAWTKSKANPSTDGSTHKTFPEEMTRKTIINRACKAWINSSSDDNLFLGHFNRADEEAAEEDLAEEVATYGNGEVIDVVSETATEAADDTQPAQATETAKAAQPAKEQAKTAKQATLPVDNGPGY